jgi:hypothetical protein
LEHPQDQDWTGKREWNTGAKLKACIDAGAAFLPVESICLRLVGHGGCSTGARTPEVIKRIRAARTKHGRYSAASIARCRRARQAIREIRALFQSLPRPKMRC